MNDTFKRHHILALALSILALSTVAMLAAARMGSTRAVFTDQATVTSTFKTGYWEAPPITATVEIQPNALQKRAQGGPVTAFIELPAPFDVRNIIPSTIRLCPGTAACDSTGVPISGAPKVGDDDLDGIADLKVTFARADVLRLVETIVPPATISFTVSGRVGDRRFAGNDTVRLVGQGRN